MALLNPQQITVAGVQATYSAAASGDTVNPDEDLVLHVINGGGSPITVTLVDTSKTPAGSSASNPTVSVTNGTNKFIYLPSALGQAAGVVTINYSAVTSVTAALLKV